MDADTHRTCIGAQAAIMLACMESMDGILLEGAPLFWALGAHGSPRYAALNPGHHCPTSTQWELWGVSVALMDAGKHGCWHTWMLACIWMMDIRMLARIWKLAHMDAGTHGHWHAWILALMDGILPAGARLS